MALGLSICGYGLVDEARDGDLWLGLTIYLPLIAILTMLCWHLTRGGPK